jgi:biopolymer transport protein TolR
MGEINVVPYIDVMLVLLVIFMVTAPMLTQGVKVDLPQIDSQPVAQQDAEPLVVTVDAAGRFYIEVGEVLDESALQQQVAALHRAEPQRPVYVRGDRNVNYGRVAEALVLLNRAGIKGVGLLTKSPEDEDAS